MKKIRSFKKPLRAFGKLQGKVMLRSLLIASIMLLASCAQVKTVKKDSPDPNKHLSPKEIEKLNKQSLKRVSKQLKELDILD